MTDPLRQAMAKRELVEAAYDMTGGNIADLSNEKIERLMTVTQYVTDLCLNEIERRGGLRFIGHDPIVPYLSEHSLETILTRGAR